MSSVQFINHILDDKNAFKLIALLAATKQQNTNPSIISAQNPGKIPCLTGKHTKYGKIPRWEIEKHALNTTSPSS